MGCQICHSSCTVCRSSSDSSATELRRCPHIFPKNYLRKIGIYSDRDRNQIANFTYLDYGTNIDISDNPPAKYVEKYRCLLGEEAYRRSCQENALPENWDKLEYFDFLAQRRKLMAQIIKKAYLKLKARTYPFG